MNWRKTWLVRKWLKDPQAKKNWGVMANQIMTTLIPCNHTHSLPHPPHFPLTLLHPSTCQTSYNHIGSDAFRTVLTIQSCTPDQADATLYQVLMPSHYHPKALSRDLPRVCGTEMTVVQVVINLILRWVEIIGYYMKFMNALVNSLCNLTNSSSNAKKCQPWKQTTEYQTLRLKEPQC